MKQQIINTVIILVSIKLELSEAQVRRMSTVEGNDGMYEKSLNPCFIFKYKCSGISREKDVN